MASTHRTVPCVYIYSGRLNLAKRVFQVCITCYVQYLAPRIIGVFYYHIPATFLGSSVAIAHTMHHPIYIVIDEEKEDRFDRFVQRLYLAKMVPE